MKIVNIAKKLPQIRKRLGEILIEAGLIDQKILEDALDAQKVQKKKLGQVLIEMGIVDDIDIADVLAKQFGTEFIRMDKVKIQKQAVSLISGELAEKHMVIPIQEIDKKLVIAMANPLDYNAVEDLRFITSKDIFVVVSPESDIENAIETHYPKKDLKEDVIPKTEFDASIDVIPTAKADEKTDQDLMSLAGLPPVIRFTNAIIADAIGRRASDIHIEPQKDDQNKTILTVRCRVDGIMHEALRTDRHVHGPMVSRIKIISGLDISERRKPQDGKAQVVYGKEKYDLRVSSIPTTYGEKITMRILDPATARMNPEDLGFSDNDLNTILDAISRSQGIILVTGPTGSGKSSTLYACLNNLNTPLVNIITVEDPVEFDVAGINQVQINVKAGITFSAGLRSILRQDPDIVMVGEIRDAETAEIAFQAAQTGHLVLSTLHTNDAPSAVTRLLDLGVDDFQISSALIAVIGQRLVRRIHNDCKAQDDLSPKIMGRIQPFIDNVTQPTFWKGAGCSICHNTGYMGRMGIYEILLVTSPLRNLIKPNVSLETLKDIARKEGFQAMPEDGIAKALQGLTTIEEVFRVAPPEIKAKVIPLKKPTFPSKIASIEKETKSKLPTCEESLSDPSKSDRIPAFVEDGREETSDLPITVLVVDDEETDRMIICDALESENYVTVVAENGNEALEKVKEEQPDLIVTDYIMPQMNGMVLVKNLKADKKTSDIPILMLTSIDDVDSEVVVMEAGADDYLTKPVNRKRFLIRVKSLLRRIT
jgi:type IV pilus assembly protein PilB